MTIQAISMAAFRQNYQPDRFMIDVRSRAEFDSGHVQGARCYPLGDIEPQRLEQDLRQQGWQSGQPVYILCQAGQRAQKAAELLSTHTTLNVVAVEGGTVACASAGIPMQQGTRRVISLERQVRIAAGSLVLIGAILGTWVAPAFYGLSAFVGAGLVFAGISDTCAMGMLLARMPWNR